MTKEDDQGERKGEEKKEKGVRGGGRKQKVEEEEGLATLTPSGRSLSRTSRASGRKRGRRRDKERRRGKIEEREKKRERDERCWKRSIEQYCIFGTNCTLFIKKI